MAYYEYQLSADLKGYYLWFEYDRELVEAIKQVPSSARRWDAEEKVWFVDTGWFTDAMRFLDHAINCDQGTTGHRGRERSTKQQTQGGPTTHGSRQRHRSGAAWNEAKKDPFAAGGRSQKPKSCFEKLHLQEDVPIPVLTAAFRALIKLHHPDVGGDPKRMVEVNVAYEEALKIKKREE
jgi:hypothetical protein